MGKGAYWSIEQRGVKPVVTDIVDIEEAVMAYVDGNIENLVEKLH